MTDTITTVLFEAGERVGLPGFMRVIAFAENEAGKYVLDILEADYSGRASDLRWLVKAAADYGARSNAAENIEYLLRVRRPNLIVDYENVNLNDIDTGRCTKLESKLVRAIQGVDMV